MDHHSRGLSGVIQESVAYLLLFAAASGQVMADGGPGEVMEGYPSNSESYESTFPQYPYVIDKLLPALPPIVPSHRGLKRVQKQYTMSCNCSWGEETQENKLGFKIVGGSKVPRTGNFPMMAGLVHPKIDCTICGATIITDFHALTAAHCVADGEQLYLWVGTHHRCRRENNDGQFIPLRREAYIPEEYNEEENHYDIAIVVTLWRIIFNDHVGPACLLTEPFYAKEDPIWILGWGKDAENGHPNEFLHKVYVKEIDIDTCEKNLPMGWISPNKTTQMCTYRDEGMDACTGDSGGPLFWMDRRIKRLALVGLVSMGLGCGRKDTPAINTAVSSFIPWIKWNIEYTWEHVISEEEGYPRRQICHAIPV